MEKYRLPTVFGNCEKNNFPETATVNVSGQMSHQRLQNRVHHLCNSLKNLSDVSKNVMLKFYPHLQARFNVIITQARIFQMNQN